MIHDEVELRIKQKRTFRKYFYLFLGLSCFTFFLPWIFTRYAWTDKLVFDASTGTLGDTIGGTMSPFVGLIGGLLTFLAFWEQYKANEQQRSDIKRQKHQADIEGFENTFFEMIRLHRENVSELNYTKFDKSDLRTSTGRKVMRVIFQEFIECYREVKKFSNSSDPADYLLPKYEKKLNLIIKKNKLKTNPVELTIIDIAYSIVFFGLGTEGESVLRDRFKVKYNSIYFYRLLFYLKFKPKKENTDRFELWQMLKSLDLKNQRLLIEEMYLYRRHVTRSNDISNLSRQLLAETIYDKYYGGHQHRLGHYFRHLFQAYKFLNKINFIDSDQKYFYAKTLRAQLSTYEQALLFINSISSLGMKWEYIPDQDEIQIDKTQLDLKEVQLISKYNLVKNLPGNHLYGITYKDYYPRVKYENKEKDS